MRIRKRGDQPTRGNIGLAAFRKGKLRIQAVQKTREAVRQRPPWRLVEADIRPSATPGRGDARLLFESLERTGK